MISGFGRFISADEVSREMSDLRAYRCRIAVDEIRDIPHSLSLVLEDEVFAVHIHLESCERVQAGGGEEPPVPPPNGPNNDRDNNPVRGQRGGESIVAAQEGAGEGGGDGELDDLERHSEVSNARGGGRCARGYLRRRPPGAVGVWGESCRGGAPVGSLGGAAVGGVGRAARSPLGGAVAAPLDRMCEKVWGVGDGRGAARPPSLISSARGRRWSNGSGPRPSRWGLGDASSSSSSGNLKKASVCWVRRGEGPRPAGSHSGVGGGGDDGGAGRCGSSPTGGAWVEDGLVSAAAASVTPRGRNCDPGSPTDPPLIRKTCKDEASNLQKDTRDIQISELKSKLPKVKIQ